MLSHSLQFLFVIFLFVLHCFSLVFFNAFPTCESVNLAFLIIFCCCGGSMSYAISHTYIYLSSLMIMHVSLLLLYSSHITIFYLKTFISIAVIITLYPTGKYCPLVVPKLLLSVVPRTSSKYPIWPSRGRLHLISWGCCDLTSQRPSKSMFRGSFFVDVLMTSLERPSKDVLRIFGGPLLDVPKTHFKFLQDNT